MTIWKFFCSNCWSGLHVSCGPFDDRTYCHLADRQVRASLKLKWEIQFSKHSKKIKNINCFRYGCRAVTIVGAILAAVGFLAAAFSHHIALLYLFFGVVAGKIARDTLSFSSLYIHKKKLIAYHNTKYDTNSEF